MLAFVNRDGESAAVNPIATPDWSVLPAPEDDGAARHLIGLAWPNLLLAATNGASIDVSRLKGRTVIFAYPRTGRPGLENPPGWDLIPGARGCTPQSCAFRDRFAELKAAGVDYLFGLSTQESAYQHEAAERLRLPFPLLSDADLKLTRALRLPTFEIAGSLPGQSGANESPAILLKRLTLIVRDGRIEHVFYPVFPPDANAEDVIKWMQGARNS
jgi:peroxiredoxin